MAEQKWESVLSSRYCRNSPLMTILSEQNKAVLWRQLWIWLAEAELELGLPQITQEAIDEMKAHRDNIDWESLRSEERRIKHDVMAHNHVFGKACPRAAGIIHLGATSCFVQDNADLIVQRQSLKHLLNRLASILNVLASFILQEKEVVTVGRTHYQAASLTTVGKRAAIWAQDILIPFRQLEAFANSMRFRGIKGATGTQDSFLTLFDGDEEKVEKLDELVTEKAGFKDRFFITGQTYTRQQDIQLINAIASIAAAVKKICTDIRILQGYGELLEPFEESQIGSSAMPYKRNPMKSERCCGVARLLIAAPQIALNTLADQGLERTLDDSSPRRTLIPETFLNLENLLLTFKNIVEGLRVQMAKVESNVREELPFLALEKALMLLCMAGADRQQAHSVIRSTALKAKEESIVDMNRILEDPFFDPVRAEVLKLVEKPLSFTGRAASQCEKFVEKELLPAIQPYSISQEKVQLDV